MRTAMVQHGPEKPNKAVRPLTVGLLLLVLGPVIFLAGAPNLSATVYPDWLPVGLIKGALLLAGLLLFVGGCVLIARSRNGQN